MDRKTQKSNAQKILNVKNKHARFIAEYVFRKEPQLYKEASNFHNMLKAKHPYKRDLTKTHEFLVQTTDYSDYRDFYNRKKLKRHQQSSTTTTTTTTTTRVDNMELNIDLLTPEVVAENTTTPFQIIPDDVYHDLLAQIRADPALQPVLNDMIAPQADDLLEDPELNEILNGLEQTPLEKEVDDMLKNNNLQK